MYFTSKTRFFIFSWVQSKSDNALRRPCHEWNKSHFQRQKHWIFSILHFLWFLNWTCVCQVFQQRMQNVKFHTCLVISNFWYFHNVKISLWKYHYNVMNKTRYFTTENVMNHYIHCFMSPMKIVSTGTHVLWAVKADFLNVAESVAIQT